MKHGRRAGFLRVTWKKVLIWDGSWLPDEVQVLWAVKMPGTARNYQQNGELCYILLKFRECCLSFSPGDFSCHWSIQVDSSTLEGARIRVKAPMYQNAPKRGTNVPKKGTGMFTTTFGASSNPCLFCSASDEPGCSCSSRAFCWGPGCAFPPVFYLDFHPPRPPQITKSPSQARKPRWEIPAMTGVICVPFSCQDSLGTSWITWALTIFFFFNFSFFL